MTLEYSRWEEDVRHWADLYVRDSVRADTGPWSGVVIESVTLDGKPGESVVAFEFRSPGPDGARYGYRFSTADRSDPDFHRHWTATEWAQVAVVNLREEVEASDAGLPPPSEQLVWLN